MAQQMDMRNFKAKLYEAPRPDGSEQHVPSMLPAKDTELQAVHKLIQRLSLNNPAPRDRRLTPTTLAPIPSTRPISFSEDVEPSPRYSLNTDTSLRTEDLTLLSCAHGRTRREERGIAKTELQVIEPCT